MSRPSEVVREQVRLRANDHCEYCQKPNIVSTYGYHVDHIIPFAHGGSDHIDNLAWACFECNVSKGRDIASYDPLTGELTRLYHPRRDAWDTHFEFQGALIVGRSAIGRVTIRILSLNQPDQVEARALFMEMGLW